MARSVTAEGAPLTGPTTDIEPGSSLVFDDQTLSIAWALTGGSNSGPGTFEVARVTLKDGAIGTWKFKGWETGGDGEDFEGLLPIPEPGTVGLVLLGGLALLGRRGEGESPRA